jgi:uncharacterized membrane-anchored protein
MGASWEGRSQGGRMRSKVPQVTAIFWLTKVLTTGMGETSSDWLVTHTDPAPAVVGVGVLFAVVLVAQVASARYRPWLYWLTVVLVGVFGTMVADVAHVVVGVPYPVSATALLLILIAVFLVWRRVEGAVSIHSLTSRRAETFYWATVVTTFALGTAAGDLAASTWHLGYLGGGIAFVIALAVPIVLAARRVPIAPFWIAYILTRPIGASFADWGAVSSAHGGLGVGTGPISVALAVGILACVTLQSRSRQEAVLRVSAPRHPSPGGGGAEQR